MKKCIIAALAVAVTAAAGAEEKSSLPLGYPGSSWSHVTFNPGLVRGTPEDNNVLVQGRFEQGIDWARLSGDWVLNTYGAVGYSADRNNLPYNNKLVPALGVKVSKPFERGVIEVGVQYAYQRNFSGVTAGESSGHGVQLYASYWFGWNLKK